MSDKILFLCPHSAAKSVIAAAYCKQLGERYGFDMAVDFAGTEPDDAVSLEVVEKLRAEGIDVPDQLPRLVTEKDLAEADWVFNMGCDLEGLAPPRTQVVHWPDVPSPSQDLDKTAKNIWDHLDRFFERLIF